MCYDEVTLIAEIGTAAARFYSKPVTLTAGELRPLDPQARLRKFRDALTAARLLPDRTGTAAVESLVASYGDCIAALKASVPAPIGVPIHVVRASDSKVHGDDALGWKALTYKGATVHWVSGDHITMIVEPDVGHLAGLLSNLAKLPT